MLHFRSNLILVLLAHACIFLQVLHTRFLFFFAKCSLLPSGEGCTRGIHEAGEGSDGSSYCERNTIHEAGILHPKKYLASKFYQKIQHLNTSILTHSMKQTLRPASTPPPSPPPVARKANFINARVLAKKQKWWPRWFDVPPVDFFRFHIRISELVPLVRRLISLLCIYIPA